MFNTDNIPSILKKKRKPFIALKSLSVNLSKLPTKLCENPLRLAQRKVREEFGYELLGLKSRSVFISLNK